MWGWGRRRGTPDPAQQLPQVWLSGLAGPGHRWQRVQPGPLVAGDGGLPCGGEDSSRGRGPLSCGRGFHLSLGLWVSCTQLTSVVCLCQNSPSTCPQKIGRLPQSCGKADSRGAAALWPSGLCVEAEGRAAPGPGEPTFA